MSKPKAAPEPVATKSLSDYLASELFNMVYMWGRVGIVVDSTAPAFQDKLKELMEAKMSEIKLGKAELELAKKISHQVWEKYDDQFGYRTEKQTYNDNVSTDIPDNIWFFWGQFDSHNQAEFTDLANQTDSEAGDKLYHWCEEQMNKNSEALARLHSMGIDI